MQLIRRIIVLVLGVIFPTVYAQTPATSNLSQLAPSRNVDPNEVAIWVNENLSEQDFRESHDIGLDLELRGEYLLVNGVVDENSFNQVYGFLSETTNADERKNNLKSVKVLVFTTVLGSADDETNLDLGCLIRLRKLITFLPARGTIASGGTDLFLAGQKRIVEVGAKIGVHSWNSGFFSRRNASKLPKDHRDHAKYLNYYRIIEIPEEFYWFTLRVAPPSSVHWMTEEEMLIYKVFTDLVH